MSPPTYYWDFRNKNTLANIYDSISNIKSTVVNGPNDKILNLHIDSGASFNGDDHITVDPFTIGGPMSFELYGDINFGADGINYNGTFFDFGESNGNNRIFLKRKENSDFLEFGVVDLNGNISTMYSSQFYGGLVHVVVTIRDLKTIFYINGGNKIEISQDFRPNLISRNTNYIGKDSSHENYLIGQVRYLKFWNNYIIPYDEVEKRYNQRDKRTVTFYPNDIDWPRIAYTEWGESTTVATGDNALFFTNFNYQGLQINGDNGVHIANYTTFQIRYLYMTTNPIDIFLGTNGSNEVAYRVWPKAVNTWYTVGIPLSYYTSAIGYNIKYIKIESVGWNSKTSPYPELRFQLLEFNNTAPTEPIPVFISEYVESFDGTSNWIAGDGAEVYETNGILTVTKTNDQLYSHISRESMDKIDLSSKNRGFSVKVKGSRESKVFLKLEGGYQNHEFNPAPDNNYTTPGEWQTIFFDASNYETKDHKKIVIFFDITSSKSSDPGEDVFFVDDFKFGKYDSLNVSTILDYDYHKRGTTQTDSTTGQTYDFQDTVLIITESDDPYNPSWYNAPRQIITNAYTNYNDGDLIRDSRLDNATDAKAELIGATYALQNGHSVFTYIKKHKTIWIRKAGGNQYFLENDTKYNVVYLNDKKQEVFGTNSIEYPQLTLPIITLNGESFLGIMKKSAYIELGATVTYKNEVKTVRLLPDNRLITTNALGLFALKYNYETEEGIRAIEQVRMINIADPKIDNYKYQMRGSRLLDTVNGLTYENSTVLLIITPSNSSLNPSWYGAEGDQIKNATDGEFIPYNNGDIIRDSRLNNASISIIEYIGSMYASQQNHRVFHYSKHSRVIYVLEPVGIQYYLQYDGNYTTVYLTGQEYQVFGTTNIIIPQNIHDDSITKMNIYKQKKFYGSSSNRTASAITTKRRTDEQYYTEDDPELYGSRSGNDVRQALRRVRSGGATVPAKKSHHYTGAPVFYPGTQK